MRLLLSIASSWLAFATAVASAQTRWDLASAYPATNFHTENLQRFADDVDRASAGRLKITVYPNATLFKAPEIKRALQDGLAQVGEVLLVNYQNEWAVFGADGLPFLASSYDDARRLYRAQRPMLEKRFAQQGLMLLGAVPWPPQGLFSKRALAGIGDLKGSKWRAYSPATSRIAELVGAEPVTVQTPELPQAMATGVVETYMSSAATGYDARSYTWLRYFYDTQAWLPKNALLVNVAAFDALPRPLQVAVLKAGADAEARGWAASQAYNGESIDLLRRNGMTVQAPPPRLERDLRRLGEQMLREWLDNAGPEGQALVDAYAARR